MAFIKNKKFNEIRESAKGGNEQALQILQALSKNAPQADLDGLIDSYYGVVNGVPPIDQIPEENDLSPAVETTEVVEEETPQVPEMQEPMEQNVTDISEILDNEMGDLLDENDVEDLTFGDFLKNKRRDGFRAKKNADYFKAYDVNGKSSYMNNKIDAYRGKFDGRKKDIERQHNDFGQSIDKYSSDVNYMLDDDMDLNIEQAGLAYDDLTGDENAMRSFGRYWDEEDNGSMLEVLKTLVVKYGKKNVMAALNTLKSDNDNYQNFKNQQIDNEIGRYSKSIESLLK